MKFKLAKIKVLAVDVDGILTNGSIVLDHLGKEIKIFNVKDGYGLVLFKKAGYKTAIITARSSKAVAARAKDLKINKIYQNAQPKTKAFAKMLKEFNVKDEEVCFMGDDLPDIKVLEKAGFAVTVPDAVSEVKRVCDFITTKKGGEGAVREIVELILKAQGRWKDVSNVQ